MAAPLGVYEHRLLVFAREMTPLVLTPQEKEVLVQFETGHRTGLGLSAWAADGLFRCLNLMSLVMLWKTVAFDDQLTGIYARSVSRSTPFFNGFSHFVADCNPTVRSLIRFSPTYPMVTRTEDENWRLIAFNPCESDLEKVKHLLTNIVYYDFDEIPLWLISQTQAAVRGKDRSITLSLTLDRKRRPTTPLGGEWFDPDVTADDE